MAIAIEDLTKNISVKRLATTFISCSGKQKTSFYKATPEGLSENGMI